jgi:ABC-2 type transport system permease protein
LYQPGGFLRTLLNILAIAVKDFLDSVKNRTVFFAILFPVLLSLIFRIVLESGSMPLLNLALVNGQGTKLAGYVTKFGLGKIHVEMVEDADLAKKMVADGKVHAALVLPDGFEEKMAKGRTPLADFWVDGANIARGAALEMFVNKILYHYNGQSPPAELVVKNVSGAGFGPGTAMLPTWLLFTILGAYMVVASSIMEERERKTLQAILVTPCRMPHILVGKGLTGIILTVCGALLIMILNDGFVGNPLSSLVIILAGTAFFTFLGVVVGLVLPSQTTANVFGSLMFMGMFLPVVLATASKKLKFAAELLPSYYVNDGLSQAMFSGAALSKLLPHVAYLCAGSLLLLWAGTVILKKKETF